MDELLGAARAGGIAPGNGVLHNGRHSVGADAPQLTIGRGEPDLQLPSALAGVAAYAAQDNVLARDNAHVIDDVLPAWAAPLWAIPIGKRRSAINAISVACDYFRLKPTWNVPSVH